MMRNDSISDTAFGIVHAYKMAMRAALNANLLQVGSL
jgi:hypothetical protein